MKNIFYFFRRNALLISSIVVCASMLVFFLSLLGSIFFGIQEWTLPTGWLICLAISAVCILISIMREDHVCYDTICRKCVRTGIRMNPHSSCEATFQCPNCGNSWQIVTPKDNSIN